MFTTLTERLLGSAMQGLAGLRRDSERGDVPGWVLITLMTAGIVAVIWAFARDALMSILHQALDTVAPSSGDS
jgi:hypothetical protein